MVHLPAAGGAWQGDCRLPSPRHAYGDSPNPPSLSACGVSGVSLLAPVRCSGPADTAQHPACINCGSFKHASGNSHSRLSAVLCNQTSCSLRTRSMRCGPGSGGPGARPAAVAALDAIPAPLQTVLRPSRPSPTGRDTCRPPPTPAACCASSARRQRRSRRDRRRGRRPTRRQRRSQAARAVRQRMAGRRCRGS